MLVLQSSSGVETLDSTKERTVKQIQREIVDNKQVIFKGSIKAIADSIKKDVIHNIIRLSGNKKERVNRSFNLFK